MVKNTCYTTLIVLLALTSALDSVAQYRVDSKSRIVGETYYAQSRFVKALDMFNKHEAKSNVYLDESFLKVKANTLYKLGQFDQAVNCYARIQDKPNEQMDSLFFKGLLNRSSNPELYGKEFIVEDTTSTKGEVFFKDLFAIQPFHILNSNYSEFAPVEHDGIFYFATNRNQEANKLDINTGVSYYDIYQVPIESMDSASHFGITKYTDLSSKEKKTIQNESNLLNIVPVDWINTEYNDGPISFSGDSIVYVTRNEPYEKGQHLEFNLNIYEANAKGMASTNTLRKSDFGIAFSPHSVGHATFSPDGTQACVSAKITGSSSNADLYLSTYEEDHWTKPINAGNYINTTGDELFPFWSDDGYIYFSSDGYKGYGGLDIYRFNPKTVGTVPENVGEVVNSEYDDFSFSINKEGIGFLSSNREGGQGGDDIYKIEKKHGTINVELICDPALALDPWFILDSKVDTSFESFNIADEIKMSYTDLPYGDYTLYHLLENDSIYAEVGLYEDEVTVYVDFPDAVDSLVVRFSNFKFDEHSLSEINQENFQKLVRFLKNNIDVQILLKGHTDQFGSIKYNQKLGMKRCEAMEEFLRERGVQNFIEKESYGRSKLVSKSDHRLNRRVDVELRIPGSPDILNYVKRGDRKQEVDLSISYDNPTKFDRVVEPGYYIQFSASKAYRPAHQVAAAARLPRNLEPMLFSESNFIFRYYIRLPFDTKSDAKRYAVEELRLPDYVIKKF